MLILHAGAGPIRYPAREGVQWVNLDVGDAHKPDVLCDCTRMAERFKPAFFDAVISVHHTEHLAFPTGVLAFFGECLKVLRPGGVCRIVVPDLMTVARKYVAGEDLKDIYDGPYYVHRDCPAERFLFFMRGWEHAVVFDEQLLTGMMRDAGFRDVRRVPFGVSDTPALCGLDRFQSESICVEGTK